LQSACADHLIFFGPRPILGMDIARALYLPELRP